MIIRSKEPELPTTSKELAALIDHSLLRPTLTLDHVIESSHEACGFNVASICAMPCYIEEVSKIIKYHRFNSSNECKTKISTVIGFPFGNITTKDKLAEMQRCAKFGVEEYDVVVNFSYVLSGKWGKVFNSLKEMNKFCQDNKAIMKVIFENCYLNERQKINLCEICSETMDKGFVKTSTGFGSGGATVEDIKLMRQYTGKHLKVKAAGGINSLKDFAALYIAGATRFGSSKTKELLKQMEDNSEIPPF